MRAIPRSRLTLGAIGLVIVVSLVTVTLILARSAAIGLPKAVTTAAAGYQPGTAAAGEGAATVPGRFGGAATGSAPGGVYPIWCCTAGNPVGLTITGQGHADGYGPRARDAAIAQAVADARDQASAAASAAGITLGGVIDMQVTAPTYYVYPPMGAASGAPGAASGTAPGAPASPTPASSPGISGIGTRASGGTAIACPYGAPCPYDNYGVTASATITWAI